MKTEGAFENKRKPLLLHHVQKKYHGEKESCTSSVPHGGAEVAR
jgi:hypothetical protein